MPSLLKLFREMNRTDIWRSLTLNNSIALMSWSGAQAVRNHLHNVDFTLYTDWILTSFRMLKQIIDINRHRLLRVRHDVLERPVRDQTNGRRTGIRAKLSL
jgi:hypothetical protein